MDPTPQSIHAEYLLDKHGPLTRPAIRKHATAARIDLNDLARLDGALEGLVSRGRVRCIDGVFSLR
jgi:hypothetical protein